MRASRQRDAWAAFGLGLVARLAVVAWARGRFPATQDGWYYDVLARRLASGAGYTWLWDNGTVTYAAHYPVGYPALLGALYRLFGATDTVAMTAGALFGAAAAYATHRAMDVPGSPRWSPAGAACVVALHPALVPYAAARMTEALTATLLMAATALTVKARGSGQWRWVVAAGIVLGAATLVRPQSLLLAPLFGLLTFGGAAATRRPGRHALVRAGAVTLVALACVAPWTVRNCARMNRCALVSVNGGWNLLIGATTPNGVWNPISVPPVCATVWDEAAKDTCFEREAERLIEREPLAWLARAPAKVAATFDVIAASPWYLHASNPSAFS
jgi:4-amino-4-deoxy-L-arabinose transferase-like glycosyltransferase